jgi:ribosomal protein S21
MALEIRKKERETSQSLVRRFTKSVQQSGILVRARKTRFRVRKKSDDMQKKAALRRIKMKKEYEVLKKLGKERD